MDCKKDRGQKIMVKCKLCEKNEATSKHHVIPKNVIKQINPDSKIKDIVIRLCDDCHEHIHFAYLNHLIMTKRMDGYNRFNSVKYIVLKDYLKSKYKKIYSEFFIYWKKFVDDSMKEFDENIKGDIIGDSEE